MTADSLRQQRNQFGLLANDYAKFRRGYPDKVFEIIKNKLKNNKTAIDVGCGTGLATKEIAKFCELVIGTDKEVEALEQAKIYAPNCEFILSPAERLPFVD
ncbi:MAG: class I SAM-dependent methyltransferase, partial [Candidatus Magasanikbacteria bacterium]|nr:class I SAM-dependent methyltransferase [Candidatus Magasanikbacteria bacterium]